MSEAALWKRTREHLAPFGRLERIENSVNTGTPDVAYCLRRKPLLPPVSGWLELKHVDEWPARPTTTLHVESLTKEQVDWATWWALAGGRVSALLQVGSYLLVLDHRALGRIFARDATKDWLLSHAPLDQVPFAGTGRFPTKEVLQWLTRP